MCLDEPATSAATWVIDSEIWLAAGRLYQQCDSVSDYRAEESVSHDIREGKSMALPQHEISIDVIMQLVI